MLLTLLWMTHLEFPTFLVTISRRLDTDNVKFTTYLRNSVPQTIVLTPPLPTAILNIIKSLNPNTATGYDNISSFFFVFRLGCVSS